MLFRLKGHGMLFRAVRRFEMAGIAVVMLIFLPLHRDVPAGNQVNRRAS